MVDKAKLLGASLLLLTMSVNAAAFAATDEAPTNAAPQTESGEGKSYLPPWMQKKDGATASQTSATGQAGGASAAAATRPAVSAAPQQANGQRRRARTQPSSRQTRNANVPFFRGVASIFGGLAR
ncbi:hypothetical protein JDN40_14535 [Rhodomicrobium vannielii ATCC 17100]|uniref:hypothetical protein n=1 Tax=Rhodomicrobium vannielii TaxID=1069 RepID=UPI001919F2DE|nr:hypothetical protein [Rhodomicrobium vannielii]MBJ7535324.1 hypothetical protein [Rhodomicrobium vannielii ATCC 17100]